VLTVTQTEKEVLTLHYKLIILLMHLKFMLMYNESKQLVSNRVKLYFFKMGRS